MRQVLLIGMLSSVFFLYIFWHNLFFRLSDPLLHHSDFDSEYFVVENNVSKLISGDFTHLYNTRMFYPVKQTLVFGNNLILPSIMTIPFYMLTKNSIVSTHLMLLLNFFLTFMAMYFLSFYFMKSVFSSVIAGLIFTYNPFVFEHIYFGHMTLFLIPLVFLFTEMYFREKKIRYILLIETCFLLQILSFLYYAFFIAISLPIYMFVRVSMLRWRISIKHCIFLISSLSIATFLGLAFIYPYIDSFQKYVLVDGVAAVELLSAEPVNFLCLTDKNLLYGRILSVFCKKGIIEVGLFPGIMTLLLLLFSIRVRKEMRFPFWILLIWTTLFSLGPVIKIGQLSIPNGINILYSLLPLASSMRAPTRIMMIGYISIALLCSFSWSYVVGKMEKRKKILLTLALLVIITLEYYPRMKSSYKIPEKTFAFYSWLNHQDDIDTVLTLPIGNDLTDSAIGRTTMEDGQYLLYGLYHKKNMVNGYMSFTPPEIVMLSRQISVNFPTNDKIEMLRTAKIDMVIVHLDEFKMRKLGLELIEKMKHRDLNLVYSSEDIYAFKI